MVFTIPQKDGISPFEKALPTILGQSGNKHRAVLVLGGIIIGDFPSLIAFSTLWMSHNGLGKFARLMPHNLPALFPQCFGGIWWLMSHHAGCPRYFWAITTNMVALTLALSTAQRSGEQHHVRRTWELYEGCTFSARILIRWCIVVSKLYTSKSFHWFQQVMMYTIQRKHMRTYSDWWIFRGPRPLWSLFHSPEHFDQWDNVQMHGAWEMYKLQFDGGFC